jgi:hypothetical protein
VNAGIQSSPIAISGAMQSHISIFERDAEQFFIPPN